jgi:hypothetical protein
MNYELRLPINEKWHPNFPPLGLSLLCWTRRIGNKGRKANVFWCYIKTHNLAFIKAMLCGILNARSFFCSAKEQVLSGGKARDLCRRGGTATVYSTNIASILASSVWSSHQNATHRTSKLSLPSLLSTATSPGLLSFFRIGHGMKSSGGLSLSQGASLETLEVTL